MVDRAVISSFATATIETFRDMCRCEVLPRRAKTEAEQDPGDGVHALIGMDGVIEGALGLSMPQATARAVVGRMIDETFDEVNAVVVDGVQELTNIIIGRAKKHLALVDLSFAFGLPKTLVGIQFPTKEDSVFRNLGMRFSGELGEFLVILTWRGTKAQPA